MTYANVTLLAQLMAAQNATEDIERNLVSDLKELSPWPTKVIRAFTGNISESMVMLSLEKKFGIQAAIPAPAGVNNDVPNEAHRICQRLYRGKIFGDRDNGVLGYVYRTVGAVDLARSDEELKIAVEVLLGPNGLAEVELLADQLDQLRQLKYHPAPVTEGFTEGPRLPTNQDVLDRLDKDHEWLEEFLARVERKLNYLARPTKNFSGQVATESDFEFPGE